MSCNSGEDFDTQPFGFLRGPYITRSNGTRFSTTAEADMIRRGYSPEDIERFRGVFGSGSDASAEADRIRRGVPRDVVLPTDTSGLSEGDLIEWDRLITELESLRESQERLRERIRVEGSGNNGGARLGSSLLSIGRRIRALEGDVTELGGPLTRNITINGLDLVTTSSDSNVASNPLNCYTDVQYHVSLSMISQDAALEFQKRGFNEAEAQIDLNTLRAVEAPRETITLASTGAVFDNNRVVGNPDAFDPRESDRLRNTRVDTGTERNYYSIENLVFKNIMEPSQTNPLVSTMLNVKMQIVEPHGMKFYEDLRDSATLLNYRDVNVGRALYRLDIYFSGYHQDTGEWTEQIDMSNGSGINIISSVMSITLIEAEVTNSGTVYEIDMVPAGHQAYRPEDFVIDAGAINSGETFRDFLDNLSSALKESKESRTQGELLRNYEFYAPSALLDSPFDVDAFFNKNQFLFENNDERHVITSGRGIDILTILEGAMSNTVLATELFNADENNDNFSIPRVHFAVRFNTIYGNPDGAVNIDPLLNDYREITHQYLIEPYVTFKQGPVTKQTLNTYVEPDSQLQRIREIVRFGMLRRIYNYIYTGENTEVIDFDIRLKAFYFNALNLSRLNQGSGRQGFSGPANSAIQDVAEANDVFRVIADDPSGVNQGVDDTIRRLFGDVNSTGETRTRLGADRLGGGYGESPDADPHGDTSGPPTGRKADYQHYMSEYLKEDLLRLEGMQVRGDPVWLLSPYANYDVDGLEKISAGSVGVTSVGAQIRPRQGQIIFLKIKAPAQEDHMNPDRQSISNYPTIIGGFYQILSVTSTFAGGKFTQSIEAVKLNHLNYVEELFETGATNNPAPNNATNREPAADINPNNPINPITGRPLFDNPTPTS